MALLKTRALPDSSRAVIILLLLCCLALDSHVLFSLLGLGCFFHMTEVRIDTSIGMQNYAR